MDQPGVEEIPPYLNDAAVFCICETREPTSTQIDVLPSLAVFPICIPCCIRIFSTAEPCVFVEYHRDWAQSSGGVGKLRVYVLLCVTISLGNVGLVLDFPNGLGILRGELYPSTNNLLEVLHLFSPSQQGL